MLHLAIICIVCAAFAPSDSTAFNGQKKNESNIFYNFEGKERNVAKVSFPSVYNVVGRNSSDCAKPGITFFYDYFIKQYQNSKSNSCSIMERVPLGENKNLHSNVDFVYRKRNLLWTTDEKKFQPKTLRPPITNRCSCSNRCPGGKSAFKKTRKPKASLKFDFKPRWKKHRANRKFGDEEDLMRAEISELERCTLSPKEKKLLFCLKRCRVNKNYKSKANLDAMQVDDDLDLNKRIKKLVEEIAVENHRKKERLGERITNESRESEIGDQKLKNEDELSPIFNNIKKIFEFNKKNVNNSIVDNTKTDPVNSVRVRYPDSEKEKNTVSSYDVLRTMRKTIRVRRNSHRSHNSNECSKNREPKYKNNLTGWSNPYSANFKANVNFLYPQRNRKFFPENTKKRRWMKRGMRRNRRKKGLRDWPILRRAFEKLYTSDTKPTYRDRCLGWNRKPEATNAAHRSCMNVTEMQRTFSLKDKSPNCMSEGWKDSESQFKIENSDSRAHVQGESTTENGVESMQPMFLFNSMEKPPLDKQPRHEKLRVIKDIDKFATEGPSANFMGPQAYNIHRRIKNHINPLRYLKVHHIRKDNIVRNKFGDSKKVNLLYERKKRHGSKFSLAAHKNWRSAPVLCIPYIRNGQADQLKCLLRVIQNMMGNPIPLKCDIFEQNKYKTSREERRNTHRDLGEEGERKFTPTLPNMCNFPRFYSKLLPPFSPNRILLNSSVPYEPVNVESFQENLFYPSSTLSPTATLSGSVHYPEIETTKLVSPCIPISFPVMESSSKIDNFYKEKVTSTETCSSVSNTPVTCSDQPISTTSPAPTCSSSAKAVVSQTTTPASTPLPSSGTTLTTTPCPTSSTASTTTCETTTSPSSTVPESSTASTSDKSSQLSTVDSYVLLESEFQNENEGISGAPSEESKIQQRVEDQVPSAVDTHDVGCADEDNPTAARLPQQPKSESTDSHYRHPESNAGFKDREMYISNYLSRNTRSENKESRRKVEMMQKLFGNDGREAAFNNKCFCHSKKCNPKSKYRGKKKGSCWMRHMKEQYYRLIQKSRPCGSKRKSKPVPHENMKPSRGNKCSTVENPSGCSWQQQNIDDQVYRTPVYVNTDYLPIYDRQTEKIHQASNPPKEIKSENLLPVFDGFNLDGGPYTYTLNPPPEQKGKYIKEFTTIPPPMSLNPTPQGGVSLKRQKRSDDYYVWPENDYFDYFYDPKDSEENSLKEGVSDTWTPPSYDMFRELAKAVAQTEEQGLEQEKHKAEISVSSTVKSLDSTLGSSFTSTSPRLPLSGRPEASTSHMFLTTKTPIPTPTTQAMKSEMKSTVSVEPHTPKIAPTTATAPPPSPALDSPLPPPPAAFAPPLPPAAFAPPPPPPPPTTTTITTATTMTTTNAPISSTVTTISSTASTGRMRSRCRGGRKSYERFSKHSGNSKTLVDSREDKERQIEELVPEEDIHGPTTLKAAVIVKGQKKFQGKPSPKVYMKVFPDSFERNEQGGLETLITTTARPAETVNIVNKGQMSEQGTVSLKSDLRLQILAVCEGYLEVVKLIKAQNQTLGEDTDENLARYCENIISQNFNFQSEKSKKFEPNELFTPSANKKDSEKESNDGPELYEDFISPYDSKASPSEHFRDVSASDNYGDQISNLQDISKKKRFPNLASKSQSHLKGRKKRRHVRPSSGHSPKLRRIRKKKEAEEDLEGKGLGKEQKQLIRLLRKRKKALLSWLLTANDGIKPDDVQETEYFDEEDLIDPESDTAQYSGTIKPRREEKSCRTKHKTVSKSRETFFPVYAKDYGYESGGELIEVEVLWRQVNEKTHENKIFKNLSVLALLLTSTPSPKIKPEETKLVGDDSEIDPETKWKKHKFAFEVAKMEAETDNSNMSTINTKEVMENSTSCSVSVTENSTLCSVTVTENSTSCSVRVLKTCVKTSNKTTRKNQTHTIISKPDPTSIVGAPNSANKTHRKISHKYGVAKDIFQEYSIEFLNYAVYILPMMLTILFLLCCLCCALQILKIQKSHKKRKKKKKKAVSSEDTSVSCTSETESKKRKRDTKRKRNSECKENYDNVHKKKSRTFWNCLKVYTKPSREMDEENDQTEKKKSFLGFLKCKRDEGKPGYSSAPTRETDDDSHSCPGSRKRKHYSDQYLTCRLSKREYERHRNEEQGEAAERRELIALLEELKKIETEHVETNKETKKEEKCVQVQYSLPEQDTNSVLEPKSQTPDLSYSCDKNVFGMPKGVCAYYNKKFQFHPTVPPSSRDYDLYEEVNELTKLLPWECYPPRNEFLNHCDIKIDQTGRCDRFLKIFRDSGMNCNRPVVDKNCKTNENESRSFIFNKYRSISMDKSEELRGVSTKIPGTEVRLMENVSPYKLSSNRDEDLAEDVENLECQLNKKKYVRLKEEGVLCRL